MRFFLNVCIACFSFFVLSLSPLQAAPSFNCTKATTKVEMAICSSGELSKLDSEMAVEYLRFFSLLSENRKPQAKAMQRLWLKSRGLACDEYNFQDCIKQEYEAWLDAIERDVLMAIVPLEVDSSTVSPFDENINYALSDVTDYEKIPEEDKYTNPKKYSFYAYLNDKRQQLHQGYSTNAGNWGDVEKVTHLRFYLTRIGSMYTAYQSLDEYFGGRCGSSVYKYLNFIQTDHQVRTFGRVKILDASYSCGVFEIGLHDWQSSAVGDLQFYSLDTGFFARQIKFVDVILTEIDSNSSKMRKVSPFIDRSKKSFLGEPYDVLINEISKSVVKQAEYLSSLNVDLEEKMSESCGIPDFPALGLSAYYDLKGNLRNKAFGFNQIKYFAFNLLKPVQLKKARKYKPYLEAALMYLEKAQEHQDWEAKLHKAASDYPQQRVSSIYSFSKEVDWIENPFQTAGFYTDETCFSQLHSPFHIASAEEWFYLFWSRRVQDGSLESAKSILQLVINYMNEIDQNV